MAASSGGNGAFSPTRSILLSFCSAFCFGLCLMYVVVLRVDFGRNLGELDSLGKRIFALQDPHGHIDIVDDSNRVSQHELQAFKGHTHSRQFGQDVLADTLYKQVRILCWILTSPQNLQKKTIHVQATWSRRCNKVIFISSQDDPAFPTVKVEAPEGRQFLWRKTRGAFKYVYDHHLNDADWFLKADDDTYVVLENLRYLLADKNPNDPVFYGRKFKPYVKQGYMSGGAGYVLSKAALKLAVEKAFPNPDLCRSDARAAGAAEDVEMGKCLSRVGVAAGDSRDSQGRERFHPFVPEHHLIKGIVPAKFWYWNYVFYPAQAVTTRFLFQTSINVDVWALIEIGFRKSIIDGCWQVENYIYCIPCPCDSWFTQLCLWYNSVPLEGCRQGSDSARICQFFNVKQDCVPFTQSCIKTSMPKLPYCPRRSPKRVLLRRPTHKVIQFCTALLIGVFFTHVLIIHDLDLTGGVRSILSRTGTGLESQDIKGHTQSNGAPNISKGTLQVFKLQTHAQEYGQDVLADALYEQVRVLCWILTSPQNLWKKTIHARATWSRRCNKVIFISSHDDPTFPTVKVDTPEGRDFLWYKTRGAYLYIYQNYLDDADWFLKADDDTYVVLENLRYFLADKNPNEPVYFGRRFKRYTEQGYMSGGAGYVLSKLAVVLVVEKGFPNRGLCKGAGNGRGIGAQEDIEIGRCLENLGVVAGDTRDSMGKETFHPFQPEIHIIPNLIKKSFWFWKYAYYTTETGPECCSDYSISFHYISPNNMYLLEYMIYHMRPFGVGHYTCPANMDAVLTNIQAPAKVPALGQKDQLGKVAGNAQVKAGDTSKSQEVPADQLMQ
ncbi:uncharacterized protein LOC110973433 [Acanthaster planci]|uniref:Glycoprotein-N-acetylgalactosamine 3-beta-galactosyltransferase 1 n=1 Tax=Acanthaster planci TaxID=133434 RepID=A0A8B7XGQ3_ACAPL|nr:uncharacterized protein LOC110973433 [Acanthaster planci]